MNKKYIYYFSIISIILMDVFIFQPHANADIVFTGDYETGNLSQWNNKISNLCCSYSGQVVTFPVRAGKYAARYELRYTDPPPIGSGKRAEVHLLGNSRIGNIGGPDEWYGFSTYFPPGYETDAVNTGGNELVIQWHTVKDPGESGRSPVLSFLTASGNWILLTRYSSQAIQTSNDGKIVVLWKAPYNTGVWNDWVVHVKWSYQSDGFIEIWKDGIKIVDYKGPNCYNDQNNIYFKWGIYKWPWNNNQPTHVTQRVVYNDEFRIGDSNSSYAEVAPPTRDNIPPSIPALTLTTQK